MRQIYHLTVKITGHTVKQILSGTQSKMEGPFFLSYAPLGADGNYNDIMNRELLLRSSELFRQDIENASNI